MAVRAPQEKQDDLVTPERVLERLRARAATATTDDARRILDDAAGEITRALSRADPAQRNGLTPEDVERNVRTAIETLCSKNVETVNVSDLLNLTDKVVVRAIAKDVPAAAILLDALCIDVTIPSTGSTDAEELRRVLATKYVDVLTAEEIDRIVAETSALLVPPHIPVEESEALATEMEQCATRFTAWWKSQASLNVDTALRIEYDLLHSPRRIRAREQLLESNTLTWGTKQSTILAEFARDDASFAGLIKQVASYQRMHAPSASLELPDVRIRISRIGDTVRTHDSKPSLLLKTPNPDATHASAQDIREAVARLRTIPPLTSSERTQLASRLAQVRSGAPLMPEDERALFSERVIQRVGGLARTISSPDPHPPEHLAPEIGDLTHGTHADALGWILQHGVVCDEVLRGNVDNFGALGSFPTVETSFFADFWEVRAREDGTPADFAENTDRSYIATPTNDRLSILVKPSRARTFSAAELARPNDYIEKGFGHALWQFPEASMPHAVVFVGVGPADIHAIIVGGKASVERSIATVVASGQYVPVYDAHGSLRLSPDAFATRRREYDRLHDRRTGAQSAAT